MTMTNATDERGECAAIAFYSRKIFDICVCGAIVFAVDCGKHSLTAPPPMDGYFANNELPKIVTKSTVRSAWCRRKVFLA